MREKRKELAELKLKAQLVQKLIKICKKGFLKGKNSGIYLRISLKTAIQEYTQNTETSFVSNLPVFIRSSEERILKTVQLKFVS